MKANYVNLKVYDWNFDYERGKRLEVRGEICSLPCEIADKYPQYFKKIIEQKSEKVVTEVSSEKLVNTINEEKLEVVTEPKSDLELTLAERFVIALEEKSVKETKKNYEWNSVKFSKEDYTNAEDKESFLFEQMNK
jgi:hypothetical protein